MFNLLFLLGILGFANSCSSSEDGIMENAPLEELIMDDGFVGEKWDGEGIPSWLHDRHFDYVTQEKIWWFQQSCEIALFEDIYKFTYDEHLMVVIFYNRYAGGLGSAELESGTMCFTDEGKRVDFNHVKGQFEQTAELIYTNQMDGENIPQVSVFAPDFQSMDWIQSEINKICAEIQEPEQSLTRIGLAYDDTHNFVVLFYAYWDKSNVELGSITVENVYTLDGEKKNDIIDNIEYGEICWGQLRIWLEIID